MAALILPPLLHLFCRRCYVPCPAMHAGLHQTYCMFSCHIVLNQKHAIATTAKLVPLVMQPLRCCGLLWHHNCLEEERAPVPPATPALPGASVLGHMPAVTTLDKRLKMISPQHDRYCGSCHVSGLGRWTWDILQTQNFVQHGSCWIRCRCLRIAALRVRCLPSPANIAARHLQTERLQRSPRWRRPRCARPALAPWLYVLCAISVVSLLL